MSIPARTLASLDLEARNSLVARVRLPIQKFIHTQGISSAFLLGAAVTALLWANSPWKGSYDHLWHIDLTLSRLQLPIHAWINEALMALFFFLVGMEIKQEMVHGELSDLRRAVLPVCAALGGMILPALIYGMLNHGRPGAYGWGVPMATDTAFSLGIMALIKGVPPQLKIFLLALAIADDIAAITVVAVFYSQSINLVYLFVAVGLLGVIILFQKLGFARPIVYVTLGVCVWLAVQRSGVHATIAGVVLGLLVTAKPAISVDDFSELENETMRRFREASVTQDETEKRAALGQLEYIVANTESRSERSTRMLHDWVAFLILPVFALANAGVTFSSGTWTALIHDRIAWGVLLGLAAGKPLGIILACWLVVRARIAQLPPAVTWGHIGAVGVLAGIGFTVSLFICALAFDTDAAQDTAKTSVLCASVVSGAAGYLMLRSVAWKQAARTEIVPR